MEKLKNKSICIWGFGIENQALVKFLLDRKIDCQITIRDQKTKKQLVAYLDFADYKNINWVLGVKNNIVLKNFDYIVRSPGSVIHKTKNKLPQTIITSAMDLFFDFCPSQNIIGVTGTKGKGSTSSLIAHILETGKKKVWLGGNIGIAPFAFIEKIKKSDWVVLELSSFQLEDITHSPQIAVITNFAKEHLAPADPSNPNYHKNMNEYWQAKLNIAKLQTKQDYLVVNQTLKNKISKTQIKSRVKYFTKSDLASKLPGEHNKENIAAALAVAKLVKIKQADIVKAVASFEGLIYRIQLVRELAGVRYYNDSFATTPEATITALKSFNQPIILIAGGADKGSDFKKLAKQIKARVKFLALLKGQATPKLKRALLDAKYPLAQIKVFTNLQTALKACYHQAESGEVVLLSTACASFGMFANYKERGRLFTKMVNDLKKEQK